MRVDYIMSASETYPRLLIVNSEPFNTKLATGTTMSNLFRGWPAQQIAQVYTVPITPNTDVCRNYWRLYQKDLRVLAGLYQMAEVVRLPSGRRTSRGESDNSSQLEKIGKDFYSDVSWRRHMRTWAHVFSYHLNRDFWRWVDDFRPQAVYSALGNIPAMNMTFRIARYCDIPIVPHFLDDWPGTRYTQGKELVPRLVLLRELRRVLLRSPVRLAISDLMACEYRQRFGGRFDTFLNCVDLRNINTRRREVGNVQSGCVTFCYVGNVGHGRAMLLKQLGLAARHLMQQEGLNIKIRVLSGLLGEKASRDFFVPEVMVLENNLQDSQLANMPNEADCCIHLDSFEPQQRSYFRLSLSTKIPLYMGWGLPILAYGPEDVNSMQYVRDARCGVVVTDQDQDALIAALRKLAQDAGLRDALGKRGKEVARLRHDSDREHKRLKLILTQVVAMSSVA